MNPIVSMETLLGCNQTIQNSGIVRVAYSHKAKQEVEVSTQPYCFTNSDRSDYDGQYILRREPRINGYLKIN